MNRRALIGGLLALAAPAVIRTPGLLMPVRPSADGLMLLHSDEALWFAQRHFQVANALAQGMHDQAMHDLLIAHLNNRNPFIGLVGDYYA